MATKRPLDDVKRDRATSPKTNVMPASQSRSTSQSPFSSSTNGSQGKQMESIQGVSSSAKDFNRDASIVLIGIRGTGKSSLAAMASTALRFRLVDSDQHFFQITGMSRAAFSAKYGAKEYRQREIQIMQSSLLDNQSNCVITCGPGSIEGKGQALLKEYAKTHPVIYVMRDTDDIQRYLSPCDPETISKLVELTGSSYRASSNFEFYNISEFSNQRMETAIDPSRSHPSLTLKNLQQDFLQLVSNVMRHATRHSEREARQIFSLLPPESRKFTYALQLPLSVLQSYAGKLQDMESTADAMEFIVDLPLLAGERRTFDNTVANNISKQFYTIRRCTRIPIIFQVPVSIPTAASLAESNELEDVYFELLHFGLRLAPEYLCVDITRNNKRLRGIMATKRSTKIIGDFFDSSPGLDGWGGQDRKDKLRQAEELGCDIIRLCQDANSMLDNTSVHHFANEFKTSNQLHRPLIAYNTGKLGRMSCWLNPTLTPVTHPILRSLQLASVSDSLVTIQEAQNALYTSFVLDRMRFCIVGSNLNSSLSPALHNAAFELCGMPHEYKPLQTASLEEVESIFRDPGFGGASITAPFKTEIMSIVEFMSPEARAIGAVNTLVPMRSRKPESLLEKNRAGPIIAFYGENTDWIGINTCISRNLSPVNTVNSHTTGLVLGAGGMARATIYAMIRLGVRTIFLNNRTYDKAEEVASHFNNLSSQNNSMANGPEQSEWDRLSKNLVKPHDHFEYRPTIRVLESNDEPWPADTDAPTIIVSSLPGRDPGTGSIIENTIPENWLTSQTGGVAIELAYSPLETPLFEQVRAKRHQGWIAVDGLQILPEQAVPQFELFTGRKAPRQLMRNVALKGYEEQGNEAQV